MVGTADAGSTPLPLFVPALTPGRRVSLPVSAGIPVGIIEADLEEEVLSLGRAIRIQLASVEQDPLDFADVDAGHVLH